MAVALETEAWHYPPELVNLLVDAIPALCRSKDDVILFFKGVGAPRALIQELEGRLRVDRREVKKHDLTRRALEVLSAGRATHVVVGL